MKSLSAQPPVRNPVNMRVIAQEAGVSPTTVSLALRDDPSISSITKERIQTIRKRLGYHPVPRTRRSKARTPFLSKVTYRLVGLTLEVDTYTPFLKGVLAACRQRGLKVEMECIDGQGSYPIPTPDSHASQEGYILTGRLTDQHIDEIASLGHPFVVVGNYHTQRPCHIVGIDLQGLCD